MIRALLTSTLLISGGAAAAESVDWVPLDAACFQMGETRAYPEEAPQREACVTAFDITRTEITVAQFAAFVKATGYRTRAEIGVPNSAGDGPGLALPPGGAVFDPPKNVRPANLNWWRWTEGAYWQLPNGPDAAPANADHPVTQITLEDANAYAAWAGARLPTEAEWEYAARGGLDGALYAWPEAERKATSDKANTWQGVFPIVNTKDDGHARTAPVGSYPPNGFGLHDMIGNVWEWTATPYSPSHTDKDRTRAGRAGLDLSQPSVPVGTIKGGSYLCAESYCLRFRPAARQAQDLAYGTSHIGFRIVRDR